jgi:hypothetical protein
LHDANYYKVAYNFGKSANPWDYEVFCTGEKHLRAELKTLREFGLIPSSAR